jgi:metal-responsive CopG/Arc/MetJ family transcriptional regulator
MQKVSFSFPAEVVELLDRERGTLSRNQFVLRLLRSALREHHEKTLHRITSEVYGDAQFAQEDERLAERFFESSPETEQ